MPAYKPEDCDILLIEAAHRGDLVVDHRDFDRLKEDRFKRHAPIQ